MSNDLKKMIEFAYAIPLSTHDISRITHNKADVMLYNDLKNMGSLRNMKKPTIILYQSAPTFGHWTLVIPEVDGKNVWEFFDSYGKPPDYQLQYAKYDTTSPYLSEMAYDDDIEFIHNDYPFQTPSNINADVASCGRWCAFRALTWAEYGLPLEKFQKIFKNGKKTLDSDELITLITMYS